MNDGNLELKNKISEFFYLLESTPDKQESYLKFVSFLRSFLRIKSDSTLPTIEIMTLIKRFKPNVFTTLRQNTNQYEMLRILTELSMDENQADHNLKLLLDDNN